MSETLSMLQQLVHKFICFLKWLLLRIEVELFALVSAEDIPGVSSPTIATAIPLYTLVSTS
jgi:hypothetical protein